MLSVVNKIKHYSLKKSTPVSLKYLFNYGTDFKNDNIFHHSQFLHQELPIRIAKRILNLQELPYELNKFAGMQNIHDEYVSSFKKLTSIKYPVDIKDCDNYVKLLEELKKNHNNVEHDIARCLNSFKNRFSDNYHIYSELIDKKLSIFYESRISIRILTGHHIALKNSHITDKNIGIIYRFKLEEILNNCINEATNVMNQKYLKVPKVIVKSLDQREITHIPNHLHYVLFETIKNSMEAVVKNDNKVCPDIEIKCIYNNDGLTINIFDKGGGFKYSDKDKLFSFLYTTNDLLDYEIDMIPISGYGHGLGMSKLYIEYFGGNIEIIPLENYGTHTIINIKSLKTDLRSIADIKY